MSYFSLKDPETFSWEHYRILREGFVSNVTKTAPMSYERQFLLVFAANSDGTDIEILQHIYSLEW